jgi:hypothetical protein
MIRRDERLAQLQNRWACRAASSFFCEAISGPFASLIERAIDEAQAAQFASLSPRKPPPSNVS